MTMVDVSEVDRARAAVARHRGGADPVALAEALEALATADTEDGDLAAAASALEEAAGVWAGADEPSRQGHCLLLAATTQRLRGDLGAAEHDLERAAAMPNLPAPVSRALDAERAEQALAHGAAERAYMLYGIVLADVDAGRDPLVRARILQRRAAAALAARRWRDAAGDLMDAESLFAAHGQHAEAEASALGAAVAIANVDSQLAERVWSAVTETPPGDGVAAAQRGIVGGRVAMLAGDPGLALRRFDRARQATLDSADPIGYLTAVGEAVRAAEAIGDDAIAYARLATAWVTVGDLLGAEAGRQLVRPMLERLRDRLGPQRFAAARTAYERRLATPPD